MKNRENDSWGIGYAAASYVLWGFLPLYWKAVKGVSAHEILAHRIIWCFLFMILVLLISRRTGQLSTSLKRLFRSWPIFLSVFASSLLISANWFIYIWAVNTNRVIETSLGYYINPLIVVLLGVFVLKEKLNRWQIISFFLAFIGVAILTIQYGHVPWVALSLALSFGLYGLTKKLAPFDSVIGLTFETMFVVPFAFIFLLYVQVKGTGAFMADAPSVSFLLAGAGVATALPLLCFAEGAKRITLAMVGFLQYIAPTIMLFLGIFVFNERFSKVQFVSFLFIWLALILFSLSRAKFMAHLFPKRKSSFEARS
ncbi:EamA family transporter RarD [Fictibacillus gelatini]|uniref:EamA family transporter RarD n=1 Tax=Fictibacillus gelatini TaxID=225985 RepID=UPI00041FE91A|nr:EamA family transporter RarD [Fictibacillus gelatini]